MCCRCCNKASTACMRDLLLFLDIDDVLCLNTTHTGWDAHEAIFAIRHGADPCLYADLWSGLFNAGAKQRLLELHRDFNFSVVLSSSWTDHFGRNDIGVILRETGMSAIEKAMLSDWSTRRLGVERSRADEVDAWLNQNSEVMQSWVVIDDSESGTGFDVWTPERRDFVVLCDANVGLTVEKAAELREAFLRRRTAGAR